MPRNHRHLLLASLLATACSGSADTPAPAIVVPFATQAHSPATGASMYLNDPITVSF